MFHWPCTVPYSLYRDYHTEGCLKVIDYDIEVNCAAERNKSFD